MNSEFARHEDSADAILAGDAFDFSERHYKQYGDELLKTLHKELFLHIGEKKIFPPICKRLKPLFHVLPTSLLSFNFPPLISSTKPHKAVSSLQIYNAIKGYYYQERIEKLRAISDVQQARKYLIRKIG
jgi:hypothetical protein